MQRIAKFEKVSLKQFEKDCSTHVSDEIIVPQSGTAYFENLSFDNVKLPVRASAGSAGYDFFLPFDIELAPGKTIVIPTGIRAKIAEGWVLMVFPRSGLGFKFRLQLDNTVGIIDSDYYDAENEGHIQIKLTNLSLEAKTLSLKAGAAFAQGVFVPFGITDDDAAVGVRTGGFGSTSK